MTADQATVVTLLDSSIALAPDDQAAVVLGTLRQINTTWSCSAERTGIKIVQSPLLYTLECQTCPSGTYSVVIASSANAAKCEPCPYAGRCEGGTVLATAGFWGALDARTGTVGFHACPVGYCCESSSGCVYDHCEGRRTGRLCGRCEAGSGLRLFSEACGPDAECADLSWAGPCAVGVALVAFVFLVVTSGRPESGLLWVVVFLFISMTI